MGKYERGFRMVGASWAVLKQRPDAVLLALGGIVMSLAVSGLTAWLLIRQGMRPEGRLAMSTMFGFVIGVGTIPMSFTNFTVAVIADAHLRGGRSSLREALAVAVRKLPRILGWTLVSLTVGTVIRVLVERLPFGGVIASKLLGLAWGLATVFVVPILVAEDVSISKSIRRSATTFKKHWGTTVAAQVGVGVLALVIVLPMVVLMMITMRAAITYNDMTMLRTTMVIAGIVFLAVMGVIGVLQTIVNVALYRFSTTGIRLHEFSRDDLTGAFQPKKNWFRGE